MVTIRESLRALIGWWKAAPIAGCPVCSYVWTHHEDCRFSPRARAENLMPDFMAQSRALNVAGVKRITNARVVGTDDRTAPIEACLLYVIHPDDEIRVRTMVDGSGGLAFISRAHYAQQIPPRLVGEIGAVWSARVILDPDHVGGPKLYGLDCGRDAWVVAR